MSYLMDKLRGHLDILEIPWSDASDDWFERTRWQNHNGSISSAILSINDSMRSYGWADGKLEYWACVGDKMVEPYGATIDEILEAVVNDKRNK